MLVDYEETTTGYGCLFACCCCIVRGMEFLALASVAPFSPPNLLQKAQVGLSAPDGTYLSASRSFLSSAIIASGLSGLWAIH